MVSLLIGKVIDLILFNYFFSNIIKYLKPHSSVLAIIADKNQKLIPVGLKKIEKFKLGKKTNHNFSIN